MKDLSPYFLILEQLHKKAPVLNLEKNDRTVIISDLHMGDGRSHDDFTRNSGIFRAALKEYYLPNGYTLILNGDVEEALKFKITKIEKQWGDIYNLFREFDSKGRLYKLTGNHDPKILLSGDKKGFKLYDALRLKIDNNEFFVYHGHQPSFYYNAFSDLMTFVLKYGANIFHIPNFSVAYNSRKRSHVEKMAYDFAKSKKIIAVIGHTHRPLFESLSKMDTMKYRMEYYLRKLQNSDNREKTEIMEKIRICSEKIKNHNIENKREHTVNTLYSDRIVLPFVFNSGTVIGKRGMTSLEISDGIISLIHWFDEKTKKKYLNTESEYYLKLFESGISRYVLKHDTLDYIFTKIQLLS